MRAKLFIMLRKLLVLAALINVPQTGAYQLLGSSWYAPFAQTFVEEAINGLAALSPAYPQDMRAIQVIDEGGKLAALQEGDLVDAEGSHTADLMPVAHPCDDPV